MSIQPYYDRDGITIYHGDSREMPGPAADVADVMVTDPPFGIDYVSGQFGTLPRSIEGDETTAVRDALLQWWGDAPALVFGSWRAPRPAATKALLVWDSGGALGMGDLSIPWKPSHQEIYVLGRGFCGERSTDVLAYPPVQATAENGRTHPHEKPVALMRELLRKCPPGIILDPFMGVGTTLRAAKDLGRRAIGIEIEEKYCEIAVERLRQEVMPLSGTQG